MRTSTTLGLGLGLVLALALAGACAAPGVFPDLALGGGKADIDDQVNLVGPLAFGGEVFGSLQDDLQYDAYAFTVRAGAEVRIEVTNRGSARDLDDILMVYGPGNERTGYASATRVAADDNAGWGAHARVDELTLAEEGSYLAIVGSASGMDRGHYRLTLECLNGACEPEAVDLTTCDPALLGAAERCMDVTLHDDGGVTVEEAFLTCASADVLRDEFLDRCESSATPPAYCVEGDAAFSEIMVPACQRDVAFPYGLVLGPVNAARHDELLALATDRTAASARDLLNAPFDGADGTRMVRRSAASGVADRIYPIADALRLLDVDPSWAEILTYQDPGEGWTEYREIEWEDGMFTELWRGGEVIGYLAESYATVSYWDPSDPEDPVNAGFVAYQLAGVDGEVVATYYARD